MGQVFEVNLNQVTRFGHHLCRGVQDNQRVVQFQRHPRCQLSRLQCRLGRDESKRVGQLCNDLGVKGPVQICPLPV